jgi:phage terminase large subunit GpA-like protein
MLSPAIDYLRQRVAAAWRPIDPVAADVWCEAHVKLSDETEAARGAYDLTDRPWWRGVLAAATDPETRTITLPASTQVGKTLSLCALILYLARNAPASALVALPSKDATVEFRDRLYTLARESGFQVPKPWRWNLRFCDIGPMRVYLGWSGSRQGLRGRRCKYVFLSEIDVYQNATKGGDPIEAANQRVKAFPSHLIFRESSPVPDPSRIDGLYEQTDQRQWWARCPECGAWQVLRFFCYRDGELAGRGGIGGLLDGEDQYLEPDQARLSAHYVCVSGCKLYDDRKPAFVSSGKWAPKNCKITATGAVVGDVKRVRDVGFRLWAAHSNAGWGEIAAEYLKARKNGTVADYFQNWLGLSHKQRGTMPTWQELGARLAVVGHQRAIVPAPCWFLTASCDVQNDEVYAVVRGWGDAKTSWLIDWWVFDREAGDENQLVKSDLALLDNEVLGAWFGVDGVNPRNRAKLQVVLLGIDTKHRTIDVHNWIRSHGNTKHCRGVQGDGSMRAGVRYKVNTVYESRRKKKDGETEKYEGGLELWSINSHAYRRDLVERFKADTRQAGAWLLPDTILTDGQHYLRQLVNEPPVIVKGKDGRPRMDWRERDGDLGHDFWDCEVNGLALADMVVDQLPGEPGWSAAKWKMQDERKQQAATRPAKPRAGDRSAR